MAPPSSPQSVMRSSPTTVISPARTVMFLSGWPAATASTAGGHGISQPQLEDVNGATATPSFSSTEIHAPSEPVCGHEPPRRARITASASKARTSPSTWKSTCHRVPGRSPVQQWRSANFTPSARSRCTQRFSIGEIQTPAPGDEKLSAHRWLGIEQRHARAARRRHFRCAQARGATADDYDLDAELKQYLQRRAMVFAGELNGGQRPVATGNFGLRFFRIAEAGGVGFENAAHFVADGAEAI